MTLKICFRRRRPSLIICIRDKSPQIMAEQNATFSLNFLKPEQLLEIFCKTTDPATFNFYLDLSVDAILMYEVLPDNVRRMFVDLALETAKVMSHGACRCRQRRSDARCHGAVLSVGL